MSENYHVNGSPYGGFAEQPYRAPVYYNALPDFNPAPAAQTPAVQTSAVQAPSIQTPVAKRNRPIRKRFAVALVCICMIGSAAFGFGGAYLANS